MRYLFLLLFQFFLIFPVVAGDKSSRLYDWMYDDDLTVYGDDDASSLSENYEDEDATVYGDDDLYSEPQKSSEYYVTSENLSKSEENNDNSLSIYLDSLKKLRRDYQITGYNLYKFLGEKSPVLNRAKKKIDKYFGINSELLDTLNLIINQKPYPSLYLSAEKPVSFDEVSSSSKTTKHENPANTSEGKSNLVNGNNKIDNSDGNGHNSNDEDINDSNEDDEATDESEDGDDEDNEDTNGSEEIAANNQETSGQLVQNPIAPNLNQIPVQPQVNGIIPSPIAQQNVPNQIPIPTDGTATAQSEDEDSSENEDNDENDNNDDGQDEENQQISTPLIPFNPQNQDDIYIPLNDGDTTQVPMIQAFNNPDINSQINEVQLESDNINSNNINGNGGINGVINGNQGEGSGNFWWGALAGGALTGGVIAGINAFRGNDDQYSVNQNLRDSNLNRPNIDSVNMESDALSYQEDDFSNQEEATAETESVMTDQIIDDEQSQNDSATESDNFNEDTEEKDSNEGNADEDNRNEESMAEEIEENQSAANQNDEDEDQGETDEDEVPDQSSLPSAAPQMPRPVSPSVQPAVFSASRLSEQNFESDPDDHELDADTDDSISDQDDSELDADTDDSTSDPDDDTETTPETVFMNKVSVSDNKRNDIFPTQQPAKPKISNHHDIQKFLNSSHGEIISSEPVEPDYLNTNDKQISSSQILRQTEIPVVQIRKTPDQSPIRMVPDASDGKLHINHF